MTADNSPQLGGQADDLSPMISSVQTRVIADARGAYLVGNFKALIDMLPDEQQRQFRKIIFSQAADCVVEELHQLPEAARADPTIGGPLPFAEAVADWAHSPAYDIPGEIYDLVIQLENVEQEEEHLPQSVRLLLKGVLERDLHVAARDAIRAAVENNEIGRQGLMCIAEGLIELWHLDVAWHLLSGLAVPPGPDISRSALEALEQDLPRMYEMRNLWALLGGMDASQAARLRQELLRQNVIQMKALLSNHRLPQQMKSWLAEFEACASEGKANPVIRHQLSRAAWLTSRDKSPELLILRRLSNMLEDSGLGTNATIFGFADQSALCMRLTAVIANPSMNNPTLEKSIHTWHLDTAWTILHDTPIPSLELTP